MLKGRRLQSGKYLVELDGKTKGKRRNKKPPSDVLSSLEKIQLHINRALGRPTPKTLPKLTDEEYLVYTSKMTALKNVKIGRNNFGTGLSNTFATPVMLTDPSYPSIPQGLAVPLPAQITQGYDIVNGNIIPAPLPSRLDAIQSGNAGRQINAPDQQNPNRPSYQFNDETEVMRPPQEILLNKRTISRDTFDRENTRQRQEQLLFLAEQMRGAGRSDSTDINSLPSTVPRGRGSVNSGASTVPDDTTRQLREMSRVRTPVSMTEFDDGRATDRQRRIQNMDKEMGETDEHYRMRLRSALDEYDYFERLERSDDVVP
jgi:hypothetical protein